MEKSKIPHKQGLYDPQFEHDACGIGFVVNIKGKKSNDILRKSLTVLCNLSHRGGVGSEPDTGDGAGILIQLPAKHLARVCKQIGIILPKSGEYGVGMIFLPQDTGARRLCEQRVEEIISSEGQKLLGWRDVPVDDSSLGSSAKACIMLLSIGLSGPPWGTPISVSS